MKFAHENIVQMQRSYLRKQHWMCLLCQKHICTAHLLIAKCALQATIVIEKVKTIVEVHVQCLLRASGLANKDLVWNLTLQKWYV